MLKRPEVKLKKQFMHNCGFIKYGFFALLGVYLIRHDYNRK